MVVAPSAARMARCRPALAAATPATIGRFAAVKRAVAGGPSSPSPPAAGSQASPRAARGSSAPAGATARGTPPGRWGAGAVRGGYGFAGQDQNEGAEPVGERGRVERYTPLRCEHGERTGRVGEQGRDPENVPHRDGHREGCQPQRPASGEEGQVP